MKVKMSYESVIQKANESRSIGTKFRSIVAAIHTKEAREVEARALKTKSTADITD